MIAPLYMAIVFFNGRLIPIMTTNQNFSTIYSCYSCYYLYKIKKQRKIFALLFSISYRCIYNMQVVDKISNDELFLIIIDMDTGPLLKHLPIVSCMQIIEIIFDTFQPNLHRLVS